VSFDRILLIVSVTISTVLAVRRIRARLQEHRKQ
jgi:hypothetical protein